jgi:pyochelin biosynthetic protein PchC
MTSAATVRPTEWLRRFGRRGGGAGRLVCFPHAGGAASYYRPWVDLVSPSVDLLAVQYPGREDRASEPAREEMHELADEIAEALLPLVDRPCTLFGHSMGAAIAFEVARRIEARAARPLAQLVVSAHEAPHAQPERTTHLQSDDELWADIVRLNGTARSLLEHADLRRLILPYARRDYRLIERYRGRVAPRLRCPVLACVGDDDPEMTPADMERWREVTDGPFTLRVFEGDHFYVRPRQRELVSALSSTLAPHLRGEGSWPSTP